MSKKIEAAEGRIVNLRLIRNDSEMLIVGGTYEHGPDPRHTPVEISHCACIGQAWYAATRMKPRKDDEVIVRDVHGEVVPREDWPTCRVDPHHWTWLHHGHTHIATGVGRTGR